MAGSALSRDATALCREPRLRRATLATSSSSHNSERPEDECYGGPARPGFDPIFRVGYPRNKVIIKSKGKSRPKRARNRRAAAMDDYSDIDVIL